MAKRISLSERRATDTRGMDVIFGGAPPTETTTESASSRSENVQETAAKPALAKVTIYIRPEQVVAIESIQLAERQRSGQKPDKSALLQEAVDLLIAKYGN